jgi:hypothetical protein
MSKAETAKIVIALAARFPASKVEKATIAAYVDDLAHVPLDILEAAIAKAVRKCGFFPALKDIFDAVDSIIPDGHIDPEMVWEVIHRAIRDVGWYREPSFKDPLILRAIEGAMGSWKNLCEAPIDDRPSNRARIIQAYQVLTRRAKEEEHMSPRLRGLINRAIANDGVRKDGVVRVGELMGQIVKEVDHG